MKRVAHCTLFVFTSVTGVEVIDVHVAGLCRELYEPVREAEH